MTRARALVAAVPPRVWTAVAGLVLLASVGVGVVLGAGLSAWRGAVGHPPASGVAHGPQTVLSPPRSSVIVVPTPAAVPHGPVAAPGTGGVTGVTAGPGAPVPTGTPAAALPAVPVVVPVVIPEPGTPTGPTAGPRVVGVGGALPHTSAGHAVGKAKHTSTHAKTAAHGRHGNRGKHLGWTKAARGAAQPHGNGVGRTRG